MAAVLFSYVFSLSSQRVLAHIGCVALGKSFKLSGPQAQVCKWWHEKGSPMRVFMSSHRDDTWKALTFFFLR